MEVAELAAGQRLIEVEQLDQIELEGPGRGIGNAPMALPCHQSVASIWIWFAGHAAGYSSRGAGLRPSPSVGNHMRRVVEMSVVGRVFGAAVVTTSVLLSLPLGIPSASAAPCPDVEVVFARGTFEPPGVGGVGQAFVDSLRGQLGGKSIDVYPVDYPASLDFATAADGVIDASNKVRDMADSCPETKMVLGGFSQGAAVIGYITTASVPVGFTLPAGLTGPMPAEMADHVAAVALFGKPSNGFLQTINTAAPPIAVGPLYSEKTLDLCIPEDPICAPDGTDNGAHTLYAVNGMTGQAAEFAARQVSSGGVD